MLIASCPSSNRMLARDAQKEMAPFSCPDCSKEVILHKGLIKVHHFKHKPPVTCVYGLGETDIHYTTKLAIYDSIRARGTATRVEVEYRLLPGVRPDVYFESRNAKVAVEIQKTAQTVEEMQRRTKAYDALNVHVVWIIPGSAPSWIDADEQICRVQMWHEFLHATYFGRVYYWQHDRFVRAAHFGKCYRYIPEGNWVEDYEDEIGEDLSNTYWYDEHHDDACYGGGSRVLRSQKTVVWCADDLDLLDDFRPTNRKEFDCKRYVVPACRLWMDKRTRWWAKEESQKTSLAADESAI